MEFFSNSSRVWSEDVSQIIIKLSEYFSNVTVFLLLFWKTLFVKFEETEAKVLKIKFIFIYFLYIHNRGCFRSIFKNNNDLYIIL